MAPLADPVSLILAVDGELEASSLHGNGLSRSAHNRVKERLMLLLALLLVRD